MAKHGKFSSTRSRSTVQKIFRSNTRVIFEWQLVIQNQTRYRRDNERHYSPEQSGYRGRRAKREPFVRRSVHLVNLFRHKFRRVTRLKSSDRRRRGAGGDEDTQKRNLEFTARTVSRILMRRAGLFAREATNLTARRVADRVYVDSASVSGDSGVLDAANA